jgi:hypothetical protein
MKYIPKVNSSLWLFGNFSHYNLMTATHMHARIHVLFSFSFSSTNFSYSMKVTVPCGGRVFWSSVAVKVLRGKESLKYSCLQLVGRRGELMRLFQ